jgi:hypothetical protein
MMAKWVAGQSGNPRGRPLRGRSVAELARAIALERVQFGDGSEAIVCTRLERLLRVLFTMALDGDLRATRCLLEYMEGRPAQVVTTSLIQEVRAPLTADQIVGLLAEALARVETWRLEGGASGGVPMLESGNAKPNG